MYMYVRNNSTVTSLEYAKNKISVIEYFSLVSDIYAKPVESNINSNICIYLHYFIILIITKQYRHTLLGF